MPAPVLLIVIGSRAEALACAPLLRFFQSFPPFQLPFEPRFVSSGQELSEMDQTLGALDLKLDACLEIAKPHLADARLDAELLGEMEALVRHHVPAAVLVVGCGATAWAAAVAAYFKHIPLIHLLAGEEERPGSRPFPDALHRGQIARLAALHLCADAHCRESIARMARSNGWDWSKLGEDGDLTSEAAAASPVLAVTGHPADEILAESLERSKSLGVDPTLARVSPESPRVVAFLRRREHHANALRPFCQAMDALAAARPDHSFVAFHSLQSFICDALAALMPRRDNIRDVSPLPHPAFVRELSRARLVVTDSLGLAREALLLDRPLLLVGACSETLSLDALARSRGLSYRVCPMDRDALIEAVGAALDGEAPPAPSEKLDAGAPGAACGRAILAWWRGRIGA
jgi:UDP-N-acetylglucosamine 2-epimerase